MAATLIDGGISTGDFKMNTSEHTKTDIALPIGSTTKPLALADWVQRFLHPREVCIRGITGSEALLRTPWEYCIYKDQKRPLMDLVLTNLVDWYCPKDLLEAKRVLPWMNAISPALNDTSHTKIDAERLRHLNEIVPGFIFDSEYCRAAMVHHCRHAAFATNFSERLKSMKWLKVALAAPAPHQKMRQRLAWPHIWTYRENYIAVSAMKHASTKLHNKLTTLQFIYPEIGCLPEAYKKIFKDFHKRPAIETASALVAAAVTDGGKKVYSDSTIRKFAESADCAFLFATEARERAKRNAAFRLRIHQAQLAR